MHEQGWGFFTDAICVLDAVVVAASLYADLVLGQDFMVVLRVWRLIRIAHGVFELMERRVHRQVRGRRALCPCLKAVAVFCRRRCCCCCCCCCYCSMDAWWLGGVFNAGGGWHFPRRPSHLDCAYCTAAWQLWRAMPPVVVWRDVVWCGVAWCIMHAQQGEEHARVVAALEARIETLTRDLQRAQSAALY